MIMRFCIIALLGMLAACINDYSEPAEDTAVVGSLLPEFTVKDLRGDSLVSPDDFIGCSKVLVFVDPSCGDCEALMEQLLAESPEKMAALWYVARNCDGATAQEWEARYEVPLFYEGGTDTFYACFSSWVPRILYVTDCIVTRSDVEW